MSKTGYEKHIKGNGVFWCSMTAEQRDEYAADLWKPVPKTHTHWETPSFGELRYRQGVQGGYSVDEHGNANNGLIF